MQGKKEFFESVRAEAVGKGHLKGSVVLGAGKCHIPFFQNCPHVSDRLPKTMAVDCVRYTCPGEGSQSPVIVCPLHWLRETDPLTVL